MSAQGQGRLRRQVPGIAHAFHERIELERARLGLSKDALANKAGVGRGTLDLLPWRVEPPSAKTVKGIAEALGIPIGEAVELAGLVRTHSADASAEAREVISRIPGYSKQQRDALLTVIAAIDAANATARGKGDVG